MTDLEQSLIDFARKNNLTSIDVGYVTWDCAKEAPFSASMHFDGARNGEIPCANERGATIAQALSATLAVANEKRAPLADAISGSIEQVNA